MRNMVFAGVKYIKSKFKKVYSLSTGSFIVEG